MEYSLLGPTGVKLSKICLGTATFGVAPEAQESDVNGMAASAALNFCTEPPNPVIWICRL